MVEEMAWGRGGGSRAAPPEHQSIRVSQISPEGPSAPSLQNLYHDLDATVEHAKSRVQFGQPIGNFQAVGFGIADMATQIEAARLMCHRAAIAADRGLPHSREASMAKLFATEGCTKIVERALHYNGASGFMTESPVQRFYRDCKVFELGEGSNELQRNMIAREILG